MGSSVPPIMVMKPCATDKSESDAGASIAGLLERVEDVRALCRGIPGPWSTILSRTQAVAIVSRGDLDACSRVAHRVEDEVLEYPVEQAGVGEHGRGRDVDVDEDRSPALMVEVGDDGTDGVVQLDRSK